MRNLAACLSWLKDPQVQLEAFVTINLAFLALDIGLAHNVNSFRHDAEYAPLYFSLAAPVVLLTALLARQRWGYVGVWRDLGYLVGWGAVLMGLVGVILHLESRFFYDRTIKSLVYAAPFAAPLAYTGLGLLLVMNRMVTVETKEWSQWVVLMALGGFAGNFLFSLTDHAQNGFFHWSEWMAVVSSALAVGFLAAIFLTPVNRRFLWLCVAVLALQALVGILGFFLHAKGNWHGLSASWLENQIHGAPPMAPLLFPNLVLLCLIGLAKLQRFVGVEEPSAVADAASVSSHRVSE
jgi:hypothetical protein